MGKEPEIGEMEKERYIYIESLGMGKEPEIWEIDMQCRGEGKVMRWKCETGGGRRGYRETKMECAGLT